jgi:hypothetical protein
MFTDICCSESGGLILFSCSHELLYCERFLTGAIEHLLATVSDSQKPAALRSGLTKLQ